MAEGGGHATGARVRAVGLLMAPHLNGLEGTLGDFDAESGRWEVELNAGNAKDWKKVRQENLELVLPGSEPLPPMTYSDLLRPPPEPEGRIIPDLSEAQAALAEAEPEAKADLSDDEASRQARAEEVRRQLAALGCSTMEEEGRAELEARGIDTVRLEAEVLELRKEEVGVGDLPEGVSLEDADLPPRLAEDFDLEVEEQQCEHLEAFLQSTADQGTAVRAHTSVQDALRDLPPLLKEYQRSIQNQTWRAERPDLLEAASDAVAALLSADNDRELEDVLPLAEEVPELSAVVQALRAVLAPATRIRVA